jgi:hypothetical protein
MVFEQGANWVHGWQNDDTGIKNPIAELADKVNLRKNADEDNSYIVLDPENGGKDITSEFVKDEVLLEKSNS